MSEVSTGGEMQDFDGADVVDVTGNKIGTVSRTYDDENGTAQLIEVRIGTLFAKHRLIPLDTAEVTAGGSIQVPYDQGTIEGSPDSESAGDMLQEALLERVRDYYDAQSAAPAASSTQEQAGAVPAGEAGVPSTGFDIGQSASRPGSGLAGEDAAWPEGADLGAMRDLGDVIEIPIVEEVLVKRPVVKEVLRIRKSQIREMQTVEGDVRKEEIEVIETPPSTEA